MAAEITSLQEHSDALVVIIGVLGTIVAYFFIRTLMGINSSQRLLQQSLEAFKRDIYSRVTCLEKDFNYLRGEHDVMHKQAYSRRSSDSPCKMSEDVVG